MKKNMATRILAWVLVVALVLGLASSLFVYVSGAATVNYVTGSSDKYSNVIANWGEREELATFLSPKAEAFYNTGNTYNDFKDLVDSNSNTEYNDGVYYALQDLMESRHKTQTSYDATKGLYPFTDCENSDYTSKGAISCFYTGNGLGPGWDGGSTWNREHTWPNSKSPTGNSENDIMMLRPTDSGVNSGRGNKAYGEGGSYYDPNGESNGKHNLHGDVARIVLYVYVRWGLTKAEGASSIWGTSGVIQSKSVLLKWMKEDPVDTWEMGRNDSVQSVTGTRNVFVDYPELAYALFNEEVPDMKTPSGEAELQNSSKYTITAVSADTSLGTVAVSGNNITATPKTGYKVSGWEVTSGTATVTQNGNSLKVSATSDCTITVSFAALGVNTIYFFENGVSVGSQKVYDGESMTMPQPVKASPADCTFLGWIAEKVTHQESKPTQIVKAGETIVPMNSATYYALYQYADPNASGNSGVFEPYNGAVVPGNYLIVSDGAAMSSVLNSGDRFELSTNITISDGRITEVPDNCIWTFSEVSSNVFTLYNESVGKYAAGTGVKNKGQMLSKATDTYAHWEISDDTDPYVIECVGNRTAGVNYTLRRNGTYGFAPYSTSTGTVTFLYKEVAGGVIYTTSYVIEIQPGDLDHDGTISDSDAIYILRYTLFPDRYPLTESGDVNSDGVVSDADAIYLLRYTLFPDRYPLFP